MQKEYVIQFYEIINKLLCNLSFAGQYMNVLMQYLWQVRGNFISIIAF